MTDNSVQPSPTSAPAPAAPAPEPATSTLAIVALVLAFLPVCLLNFVGLVCGIVALVRISGQPALLKGKGLAIAAIVVGAAWLSILAAIAVPSSLKYLARAKQSEAQLELKSAYAQQQERFANDDKYASTFAELKWQPSATPPRYTYYLANDVLAGDPPQPLPAGVETFAREHEFRMVAVGNVDSDPEPDVWMIDQEGAVTNTTPDVR